VDKEMRECENLKWPMGIRYGSHIAILSVLTLVLGIYFIGTTVLIAKDGTFYIETAKKMADDASSVLSNPRQFPGYPVLIYLAHKVTVLFYDSHSLQGWIFSAQAVSLLSKMIAMVVLYFVGCHFVGSRFSFWGILILSILPDSVDYGCDALTDWSSLLFLATGFLLLLSGVQSHKYWIFGCAGVAAGLGYLVRPECGQIVLYGCAWLLFNLVRPQGEMKKIKVVGLLILFLAGFVIVAIPYMISTGYVFPEQNIGKLPGWLGMNWGTVDSSLDTNLCLAGLSLRKIIGSQTLITNVCETLMYYFVLPLLIGGYCYYQKRPEKKVQSFFIAMFIVVNIAIMIWQQSYRGPLPRRYTLPLVAFTIFYIPIGMHQIACWLSSKTTRNNAAAEDNIRRWFLVLLATGMGICAIKLVGMAPLRWEKQGCRDAAEWLHDHTVPADIIACLDSRIPFYAERQCIEYYAPAIPDKADYIVIITKNGKEKPVFDREIKEEYSTWLNTGKKEGKIMINRVVR
jgi:hypothetical protein